MKSALESVSKDKFKQKVEHMLNPDESQLKQIGPIVDKFSEKAYTQTKDYKNKMYESFDSLYIELKPLLKDEQKQKFEKRLNHIKTEISK
jgi:SAM-dependent MidA family methyltransferase